MLTAEDIQKLIDAEKEVFTTKEDLAKLEQLISDLLLSRNGCAVSQS